MSFFTTVRWDVARSYALAKTRVALALTALAALIAAVIFFASVPTYEARLSVILRVPETALVGGDFPLSDYVAARAEDVLRGSALRDRLIAGIPAVAGRYDGLSASAASALWSEQLLVSSSGSAGVIRFAVRSQDAASSVQILRRLRSSLGGVLAGTLPYDNVQFQTVGDIVLDPLPVAPRFWQSFFLLAGLFLGTYAAALWTAHLYKIRNS